jgi:signal transduction protein with GAF and PtsI domain
MLQEKAIEYFRIFFEISQTILSSSSLEEILKLLVKRTVDALGANAGSLRMIDEKTNRLELAASHLLSQKYLNKGPLNADQSVPEVLKGKVVLIKEAFKDPRIQYQSAMLQEGINTMLSVPVIARDKVIGVLRLYMAHPRDFSEEEIEFVSALAEMGGLAIANARIYEEEGVKLSCLLKEVGIELPDQAKRRKQRFKSLTVKSVSPSRSLEFFRVLHEITKAILSTLNSREVMALIIDKAITIMNVKACALRLINETTRELELLASKGVSEHYLKKGPLHVDKSIRETLEGFPVLVLDAKTDPCIQYHSEIVQEGIASILSLPIVAMERVVGILRLYSGETRQFSQEEVSFLSALAEIAGIVIINAKLYEKIKYDLSFWTATLEYLDVKPN